MTQSEKLKDQLQRAYFGNAWHGPALKEALENLDSKAVIKKPVENLHNIWEIVLHISTWIDAVRRRLEGEIVKISPEEDWPEIKNFRDSNWLLTIKQMDERFNLLLQTFNNLNDESLDKNVNGEDYNVYFMIEGLIQHTLYHTGQVILLKKSLNAHQKKLFGASYIIKEIV